MAYKQENIKFAIIICGEDCFGRDIEHVEHKSCRFMKYPYEKKNSNDLQKIMIIITHTHKLILFRIH